MTSKTTVAQKCSAAIEIRKYYLPADILTWVGARDACASKKTPPGAISLAVQIMFPQILWHIFGIDLEMRKRTYQEVRHTCCCENKFAQIWKLILWFYWHLELIWKWEKAPLCKQKLYKSLLAWNKISRLKIVRMSLRF